MNAKQASTYLNGAEAISIKVVILVTTMFRKDNLLYKKMNLQTDAVIANQGDQDEYIEESVSGHSVRLVSTTTRGLSKNRNIAIDHMDEGCDILVFSDDDLVFHDGYERIILDAFCNHLNADAIKFNLNCISERKISMSPIKKFHRLSRRDVTSFGVCGLAIKRSSLAASGIRFNERFGPGTENYCGEDTIFLQELFKKGVRLYGSPEYIADIDQSKSTWFEGYTERYYMTKGMILHEIYPLFACPLAVRSAYRMSKRDHSRSFGQLIRLYFSGIRKNRDFHAF